MLVVKDVVYISVLVELCIGGLAINSSRIEKCFLMRISSRELVSGSDPRGSLSDSPPLSEIISFSNRLFRVSLSTWLSMTCEVFVCVCLHVCM